MSTAVAPPPVAALPPPATQRVVLVVDDAVDTLRMVCEALSTEGYTVLAACDAQEALERFDMVVPDGVLLDAVMPGIDGFTLCQRIKANPAWSHVPVVFMTGLSETDQILRGFACGGVDYVVKPLRIAEVLVRLATHVRNARSARFAREAVDVAGQGVAMLDAQGRIAWQSPRARQWLQQVCAGAAAGPGATEAWLAAAVAAESGEAVAPLTGGRRLLARYLGQGGLAESMVLLRVVDAVDVPARGRNMAALTPRESEVLAWLAKGKTNRDIADILGMSPRTVNKHLEHIFEKLGVETRTAAAALAVLPLQAGRA